MHWGLFFKLGFQRPSAAKTLAGSLGGDQSGRINFSHSINEELARSDWMGLSGGDQSGRINSSHSIIEELARSDWMGLSGGDQSGRINTSHSIIEELARFGHFGSFFAILPTFGHFLGKVTRFLIIEM